MKKPRIPGATADTLSRHYFKALDAGLSDGDIQEIVSVTISNSKKSIPYLIPHVIRRKRFDQLVNTYNFDPIKLQSGVEAVRLCGNYIDGNYDESIGFVGLEGCHVIITIPDEHKYTLPIHGTKSIHKLFVKGVAGNGVSLR